MSRKFDKKEAYRTIAKRIVQRIKHEGTISIKMPERFPNVKRIYTDVKKDTKGLLTFEHTAHPTEDASYLNFSLYHPSFLMSQDGGVYYRYRFGKLYWKLANATEPTVMWVKEVPGDSVFYAPLHVLRKLHPHMHSNIRMYSGIDRFLKENEPIPEVTPDEKAYLAAKAQQNSENNT
jgi:hypothetical protein